MAKKMGAQSVETIPGRKIVLSAGVGKTNAEELKWLTDTVLASATAWKSTGWAYIADCSQMAPVGPSEGGILVEMTKKFVEAGCKAFVLAHISPENNTPEIAHAEVRCALDSEGFSDLPLECALPDFPVKVG